VPLKRGKSKATRNKNVKEMIHSKTFAEGKPKAKRIEMAVAAAYSQARRSGRKKK
jgi:hypothetical protein